MEKQTTDQPLRIRPIPTPNPLSMKFILPVHLSHGGAYYEYARKPLSEATPPPLVLALFDRIAAIEAVFVMENFVTLTTTDAALWRSLVPMVEDFFRDYLSAGHELAIEPHRTEAEKAEASDGVDTDSLRARIEKILEEYVQPAVQRDGGLIAFHSYEAGLVRVRLRGACSGCPSATLTLKGGIERLLRSLLPHEVEAVEAIEE